MNRLILSFLLLTAVCTSAQIHEIGVFVGGSNFIGDVGETTYIKPNEFAYGLMYKWNRSARHSWRASISNAKITADDSNSDDPSRKARNYDFENTITEVSLGLEFNFFEFDLHQLKQQFTPYVFLGLTYTQYKGLFYEAPNQPKSDANHGTLSIPFALGIKTNITNHLIVGFEVAPRYTLADNIDGSFPRNDNLQNARFGNINNNDWYVFSGFTLTYTFGRKPCFCD
jgi:hypothetical protein